MKSDKLQDAIGAVRDDFINEADSTVKKKPLRLRYAAAIAAVLVCAILVGVFAVPALWKKRTERDVTSVCLAKAVYPKAVPFPDVKDYIDQDSYLAALELWQESLQALHSEPTYQETMTPFIKDAVATVLTGSGEENLVCSPLNIYMALAMLAETTDAKSRQQILTLLGTESIEALREQSTALWKNNYRNDTLTTTILADSIWLQDGFDYNQSTLDRLASDYYASSFSGTMGSKAYNQQLHDWMNEQTGKLLKDRIDAIELSPDTVLSIVSTINYQASWKEKFDTDATSPGVFHTVSGEETCDFMHTTEETIFCWGDHFSAVKKDMQLAGSMYLILPDQGTEMDSLLNDTDFLSFISAASDWTNNAWKTVNLSLPRFDITSERELKNDLMKLGVHDVFDPTLADFTPLTKDGEGLALTNVSHGVRFIVDEEGCKAAAYTELEICEAAQPDENIIDFTLDRPFLFVLTGEDGLPLFVGVVNHPT